MINGIGGIFQILFIRSLIVLCPGKHGFVYPVGRQKRQAGKIVDPSHKAALITRVRIGSYTKGGIALCRQRFSQRHQFRKETS
jgi:hypothetical protein